MNNIVAIVILLLVCSLRPANALDVTVENCVDLALQNNRTLKAFEMDSVASAEQVGISRNSFLPSLKLNGTYFLSDQDPRLVVDSNAFAPGLPARNTELSLQTNSWYFLNISLAQPLFTGGKLTHTYLRSKAQNEEATHRSAGRKREVALDVRQTFYAALNARLYTRVIEKTVEAKRERLRVLRELRIEGDATYEEILQQETDIQFAELELVRGKNREALALSRLKNLIHHTGNDDLQLRGTPLYRTLLVPLEPIRDAALANREDLKTVQARTRVAEEEISIEKSAFFPHASLTASFIQQKETNITRSQQWLLAAQLEWSLFEWGKTVSEVSRKTAQKQKVSYEAEELRKDALLAVEQAWRTIKEQEKNVQAQRKKLETVFYRLNREAENYANGKARLTEVIETESEFTRTFSDYLTAVNDLNSYYARLEESTCSDIEPWSRHEEILRPELDTYSSRLREIFAQRKRTRTGPGAVEPDAAALQQLIKELTGSE